ncbi:hypothetical protein [Lysobacter fragariae]
MNAHAKTGRDVPLQSGAAAPRLPVLHAVGGAIGTGRAEWLKPEPPFLPQLSNLSRVFPVVDAFRAEFNECVDAAFEHLFHSRPFLRSLAPAPLWRLALSAQRYGAIYFLGRRDAAGAAEMARDCPELLDALGRELSTDQLTNRLFNFAICAWIHGRADRRRYSPIRLPRNGMMARDRNAVFVNRRNFDGITPADVFDCGDALYDLHDFVHYLCACISPELYGCKYFGPFSKLERDLQALIRDHRHQDEAPTLFGDSLMFRQLSLGLFDALQHKGESDRQLVEAISLELARYLRAETGLLQPATGRVVHAPHPLDVRSLAALSQNKAYEHTASECEELVFVRGAPSAPDTLSPHGTAERIALMTRLPMQYHERRNYLRHRAHKRAYLLHARHLRQSCADDTLDAGILDMVINNLTFADYLAGSRLDLFEQL